MADHTTPAQMVKKAEDVANQCVGLPFRERAKILHELKQANPTMHSLVVLALQRLRDPNGS